MRINLTQHNGTEAQKVSEPKSKERIQTLLTFEEIPSRGEISHRASELAEIALSEGATEAMIGGAPYLMPALETALIGKGIMPLHAFTKREVVETRGENGEVVKKAVFNHLGFVEAGDADVVDSCRRMRCGVGGYTTIVDGRIIYQAVSSHPWKNRNYVPSDLGEVAPRTEDALAAAGVVAKAGSEWQSAIEAETTATREAWIESLSDTVEIPWEYKGKTGSDLYRIDKDRGEVVDNYGNYFLSLPSIPVDDLVSWINENRYNPE